MKNLENNFLERLCQKISRGCCCCASLPSSPRVSAEHARGGWWRLKVLR